MGLTKGLKQIAADFINLLGKDKAHRGNRRDERTASEMRSTRPRSARYSAGAPTSGSSSPPPHSSLPHIPAATAEFAFSRDALSDDGARTASQPPQHHLAPAQKENHISASNPVASPSVAALAGTQASFCTSPAIGGLALSHAYTAPLFMTPDSGPTSNASEDQQLEIRRAATYAQTPLVNTVPVSVSTIASDCNSANTAAAVAAAAAATTSPSPDTADATSCCFAGMHRVLLPAPPAGAAAAAADGAAVPESPRPVCRPTAPAAPLTLPRVCSQAGLVSASASRQSKQDCGQLAGERSGAALGPCSAVVPGRPMPPVGQLYTSQSLPAEMRLVQESWSVDDFEIGRKLHKGYSSSVYKACCVLSGTDVCIKAYNLAGLSTFLRNQVLRELDIHSKLRHPGAVHLMAAFREGDNLIMVQEYVRGGSLDRVRRKLGGRMTEFQTMHLVLLPLLGVLTYLHERGIVHRDIKPDNLLFTDNWKLKVCDFGVSICLRDERAVTRTGTREYLAPEVDRCPQKRLPEDNKTNLDLAYSSAVDVWSLGSLMYELLVGFTPFPGGPPARREGARGSAGACLAFPSSVSQGAREFVRDCLQLDPTDRPTVHQLLEHVWVQEALVAAEALIVPVAK